MLRQITLGDVCGGMHERPGQFWEYHGKLYAEQRGASVGAFTRDNLKLYAADVKLDRARFD